MAFNITVEGMSGEQYSANTHHLIVEEMRLSAWGGDASDGVLGYMKQVAKRVYDWSGQAVHTTSPKKFLEDLAKHGLVRIAIKEDE